MADSSEVKNNTLTNPGNSAGDSSSIDEDKPRIMKRARQGMISSSTDNSEDSEPDEKRPAFRLQPPTLIHGKAKPVPKEDDSDTGNAATSSIKCKFLQPSKLSALSSSTTANKAVVIKEVQSGAEPEPLVSSSNPFLLMAENKADETADAPENAVDSSDQPDQVDKDGDSNDEAKVNGNSPDETAPDSTTDVDTQEKVKDNESKQENLFSQASGSSAAQDTGIGNFVFGSKMEDRVVISGESKSPNKEKNNGETSSVSSGGFVFGQNLSERAKVSSSTDSNPSFLPTTNEATNSADSSSSLGEGSQDATGPNSPSSSEKKQTHGLEEDAAAHFLASQSRPALPEVEVKTGEEDEKNVLQIQCKLHQFDAVNKNWLERGVGSLHLNDGKYSDDNLHFQSRLVMRVHGSLRLVLNTKIWPQMTVERASNKSVRVSAQTDDGSIGVFLITGTINDAEQIIRALEYRVLHQKQLEDKRKALEKKEQGEKNKEAKESTPEKKKDSCSQGEPPTQEVKDESIPNHQVENSSSPETQVSEPKNQTESSKKDDPIASEKSELNTSDDPL